MDIKKIIIAVDGHSSCGKSTVAKDVAQAFGLTYIDTGAMYRAVTLFAMRNKLISDKGINIEKLQQSIDSIDICLLKNPETLKTATFLNGENVENEIRTMEVSNNVSAISALGFVRKRLVELQQNMGKMGGVILDGRDIGTVVFPDADLKIFMTASPEIRAQRRYDEMLGKGEKVKFEDVLNNVESRDHIDSTRVESPLKKADDAVVLDNSDMTREEQLDWIFTRLKESGWISSLH